MQRCNLRKCLKPCRLKPLGQFSKIQLVREFPGILASTNVGEGVVIVVIGPQSFGTFLHVSALVVWMFTYLPSASTFLPGARTRTPIWQAMTSQLQMPQSFPIQHSMLSKLWWIRNTIINFIAHTFLVLVTRYRRVSLLPLFISLAMADNDQSWGFCISSFAPSSNCFVLSGWIGNFWLRHC